jgi:hypothetical protein
LEKLPSGDHPVLTRRQLGDHPIRASSGNLLLVNNT